MILRPGVNASPHTYVLAAPASAFARLPVDTHCTAHLFSHLSKSAMQESFVRTVMTQFPSLSVCCRITHALPHARAPSRPIWSFRKVISYRNRSPRSIPFRRMIFIPLALMSCVSPSITSHFSARFARRTGTHTAYRLPHRLVSIKQQKLRLFIPRESLNSHELMRR